MRKLALVTGAASGLGLALSDELERQGWRVARCDKQPGGIDLDVCDPAAFRRVVAELGPIDLLVNNAGIGVGGLTHRLQVEDWSKVLDVNLHGVIHGIQAVYPQMVERRSGHILNTASLAGLLGLPGALPYTASKFAVVGMSLSLRAEAQAYGVNVSTFCPGFLKTNIYGSASLQGVDRSLMERRLARIMLPVEGAARVALRGLWRRQAIITYPFYASLATWPMRLNHFFAERFHRRMVHFLREEPGP